MGPRHVLGLALVFAVAACGDDEVKARELPEPPVFETVVPGIIFTRGPEGKVFPGAEYDDMEQVRLYGAGLEDGEYVYEIVDPDCTVQLAGGDAAERLVVVVEGAFGGVELAPFDTTPDPEGRYRVYMTEVTRAGTPDTGCFGFSSGFRVETDFILRN